MCFEVRCCSSVLGILEAPYTTHALEAVALLCGTVKEVVFVFALISNLDIGFEETVYC
jgi:hypothetical protein